MATIYNRPYQSGGKTLYYSGDEAQFPGTAQSNSSTTMPVAQAPVTPTPQIPTPVAPQATTPVTPSQTQNSVLSATQTTLPTSSPTTTVNVNTGQSSGTQAQPQNYTVKSGDTLSKIAQQSGLSIVDLLNQNPQYQQNPNLIHPGEMVNIAKKYQAAFDANKTTTAPQSNPDAKSALNSYFQDTNQTPQEDPQQNFFDTYMAMNPVVKTLYDTINHQLSTPITTQTFADEYAKVFADTNIPAGLPGESLSQEQVQLMNIKNIMDGTEDDIRTEIAKVGGFATDSQVLAITGARNKTLLKQANTLQQSMALKQDYVDHLMNFSQLDRAQVEKDVDRKLGLVEKLANIQDKMTSAATDNYKNIVSQVGYGGLAEATADNPQAQKFAEQSLGLPSGALSNPMFTGYQKPVADKALQFVSGTANQSSGVFDPNTGKFTASGRGGSGGTGGGAALTGNSGTQAYINAFNNATAGMGAQGKKQAQTIFNGYINTGNLGAARDYITRVALANATADQQNQSIGRTQAITAMNDIQNLLAQAKAKGVDTNLLTGNIVDAANKFGTSPDTDLNYIGSRILQSLITYRKAMTGVAFGPQEAADYKRIFPDLTNIDSLNTAKIQSLKDALNANNRATLAFYIGADNYDKLYSDNPSTSNLPSNKAQPGSIVNANGSQFIVAKDGETLEPVKQTINWGALNLK